MRLSLIQELHKSLEYKHIRIKEIVKRLLKEFIIPRMRAKVQKILGNYLVYY